MKAKTILALELHYQGQTKKFESSESTFTIGRTKACALSLPKCDVISREHLRVEVDGDEIWITDLGSSNGTFYRKAKLMPNMACLYTGDVFFLGAEGQGVKVSMTLTAVEQENTGTRSADYDKTEAIIAAPFLAPEAFVTPDKEDEHLLKMQMIEAEIDELNHKKHLLQDELADLALNETKYRLLENEFKSNLGALARIQVELEEKHAQIIKVQNELAQLQVAIQEATDKETEAEARKAKALSGQELEQRNLKNLIDRIEAKEVELNERAKMLDACEAQVATATEKFEELTNEALKRRKELYSLEDRIKESHKLQENLDQTRKTSEQQISILGEKILDLEAQKTKSEKDYLAQCEREDETITKLKTAREECEAQYAHANTEYERIKQKTKFELESLDAESKLKKTVLEREVEEILTRKTVVLREVDDTRRLVVETQSQLDGLHHSVQTEQTRFSALRGDVQKIEAEKSKAEEQLNELNKKRDHLDHEIQLAIDQATERARLILAETEARAKEQAELLEARKIAFEKDILGEREAFNLELQAKRKQEAEDQAAFQRELDESRKQAVMDFEAFKLDLEAQKDRALFERATHQRELDAQKQRLQNEHEERVVALRAVSDKIEKDQMAERDSFIAEMGVLRKQATLEHEDRIKALRGKAEKAEQEQLAQQQRFIQEMEALKIAGLEAHEANLRALKEKTDRIEKEQYDQTLAFTHEFEEVKRRAHHEHENTLVALKENETQLRNQYAEELRIWSADEEARVKTIAAKNVEIFAHSVAMRTLSEFPSSGSIPISALMGNLEKKIIEGITGQVQGEGIYNPNFKEGVRKFWVQAASGVAALVMLGVGLKYGPQFIGSKLETLKVANKQEDARFMEEVKQQRERMLALHLEAKEAFQEHYVDNILYNPGYLAMKLNPEVQKQWTVALSKFFFEELLFDDRKVVEFMPIESSLMSNLNETYKILNSQNFDANLVKMKQVEEQKAEEMWLLVGGRDNWMKIRKKEAAFYAEHGLGASKSFRTPASP